LEPVDSRENSREEFLELLERHPRGTVEVLRGEHIISTAPRRLVVNDIAALRARAE
jgi:hypothetical protein